MGAVVNTAYYLELVGFGVGFETSLCGLCCLEAQCVDQGTHREPPAPASRD